MLEARNLRRRKPDSDDWLLDDISLRLEPGQRAALVGPSGSGKSLSLRALALLDPLDGGQVIWQGMAVADSYVPDFRRQVVYLQQRPALFAGTVELNLQQPFILKRNAHLKFDRARAVKLLSHVGRESDLLSRRREDLSGGESQLVALIRALLLDPQVLLLDEPTASLDSTSVRAVEDLVDQWHGGSPGERSLIWVSHDAAQAARVADTQWQIDKGRLQTQETAP